MRWHFRVVLTVVVAVAAFAAVPPALHLMNLPSDRAMYGGMAILLGLAYVLYLVVNRIWRNV